MLISTSRDFYKSSFKVTVDWQTELTVYYNITTSVFSFIKWNSTVQFNLAELFYPSLSTVDSILFIFMGSTFYHCSMSEDTLCMRLLHYTDLADIFIKRDSKVRILRCFLDWKTLRLLVQKRSNIFWEWSQSQNSTPLSREKCSSVNSHEWLKKCVHVFIGPANNMRSFYMNKVFGNYINCHEL